MRWGVKPNPLYKVGGLFSDCLALSLIRIPVLYFVTSIKKLLNNEGVVLEWSPIYEGGRFFLWRWPYELAALSIEYLA